MAVKRNQDKFLMGVPFTINLFLSMKAFFSVPTNHVISVSICPRSINYPLSTDRTGDVAISRMFHSSLFFCGVYLTKMSGSWAVRLRNI
jgi:hypothetical protein